MSAFHTSCSTKAKTNNNNNNNNYSSHSSIFHARHTIFVPARMLPMLLPLLLCHLALVVLPSEATLELPTAALLQQAYEKETGSFLRSARDVAHHQKHAISAYKLPNQPATRSNDADADVGADTEAEAQYVDAAEQRPDVEPQLAHLTEKHLLYEQLPNQQQQQPPQPVRHCHIEFTTKIPGICQRVKPIGNACISGEYMDMFNLGCM